MKTHSLSDVQNCIHRQGKTGAKIGCASLPVYGCAIHGKCIDRSSCRSGNMKVCNTCKDLQLPAPPESENV